MTEVREGRTPDGENESMNRSAAHRDRIVVVSGGSAVRYLTHLNHAVFAEENGFSHRLELSIAPDVPSPYWYKFLAIRNVLKDFDWVLWMDDDAYFTDWHSDDVAMMVETAEDEGKFLVIAEGAPELDGTWTTINTGVMLLKNDPRTWRMLDLAAGATPAKVREWWVDDRDGFFTNGDQDTIWWALATNDQLANGFTIVPHRRLNSRAEYYGNDLADAAVVHFPGPGDKVLRMGRFARRFGLGRELVPDDLLRRYTGAGATKVQVAEIYGRQTAEIVHAGMKRVQRKLDFVRATGRWR